MAPADLVQVLQGLPSSEHPRMLVSSSSLDDGGVYLLQDDLALIQTLDFFPPIVDDPLWYGRIAAANALSDVYAMGGTPITAMNIVGWPKTMDKAILTEILRGGLEKVIEAGAAQAGGHTVTDDEIKYGLSVTGTVRPDEILANRNLKAGQVLVLSKPLGMGAFSTALKKQGAVDDATYEAGCASMATLNNRACEIGKAHGVRAATDITGFGLVGHLTNLARESKVRIEVDLKAAPVFEPSLGFGAKGWFSGGAVRGQTFYKGMFDIAPGADPVLSKLVFDAETSGGLAMGVDEDKADALVAALRAAGLKYAAAFARTTPLNNDGIWISLR